MFSIELLLSFILLIFIFIFWGVRGWGGGVGVKNFDCGHFTILTHLIKTKFCNQTGRLNFPFHKTVGRAYSYNNTIRKGFLKYLLTYTKHKLNNSVKHTHNFLTVHQQLVSTASQTFDIQLLFNKILFKDFFWIPGYSILLYILLWHSFYLKKRFKRSIFMIFHTLNRRNFN